MIVSLMSLELTTLGLSFPLFTHYPKDIVALSMNYHSHIVTSPIALLLIYLPCQFTKLEALKVKLLWSCDKGVNEWSQVCDCCLD